MDVCERELISKPGCPSEQLPKRSTRLPYLLMAAWSKKKGKKKVQGVPQSQTAALPRQEEEKTDKTKQAQIEQTYEKH